MSVMPVNGGAANGRSCLRQPYYVIGQWRLPDDRQLRAFVCATRGALYLTRVHDDRSNLTAEQISDCYKRIFPDLLRRLQHFNADLPGLLKDPLLSDAAATLRGSSNQRGSDVVGDAKKSLASTSVPTTFFSRGSAPAG